MLRMVRWQSVLKDAERIRNWRSQDRYEVLARTIHMADERSARRALLTWFKQEKDKLLTNPRTTRDDLILLRDIFLEMHGKILGRNFVMSTELGYHSQNVGPEQDRVVHDYGDWCSMNLKHVLGEGREAIMTGHMGTGKSHLAVSFMEHLLQSMKRPVVHVVTNISGIKDPTGKYSERIHHVTLLSEVLRIWAKLPAGCLIVFVVDEPETNLRGGTTKSVRLFSDFRYMLRKLGMSKLEIWHNQDEVYKSLREENSDHVTRLHKEEKHGFAAQRIIRGDHVTQAVSGVGALEFLSYAHRGMGSIDVDVNMKRLIRALSTSEEVADMKQVVKSALADAAYYLPEYRPDAEPGEQGASREKVILHILKHPDVFLTQKRHVNHEKVREEFGLKHREAREVAQEATKRWRDANPDWQDHTPNDAGDEG